MKLFPITKILSFNWNHILLPCPCSSGEDNIVWDSSALALGCFLCVFSSGRLLRTCSDFMWLSCLCGKWTFLPLYHISLFLTFHTTFETFASILQIAFSCLKEWPELSKNIPTHFSPLLALQAFIINVATYHHLLSTTQKLVASQTHACVFSPALLHCLVHPPESYPNHVVGCIIKNIMRSRNRQSFSIMNVWIGLLILWSIWFKVEKHCFRSMW